MRISLLRRVVFVALLWAAVAFGSTASLEATYCVDCAPNWSACNDTCWAQHSSDPPELEACLDTCEANYWECTFTCDTNPYCAEWSGCLWNEECAYVCGWHPAYCDQQNGRCCCDF